MNRQLSPAIQIQSRAKASSYDGVLATNEIQSLVLSVDKPLHHIAKNILAFNFVGQLMHSSVIESWL